ncbi:MAG: phosphoribosylglycinamide formyltransferase, partial [Candidatus Marinimicrobia bacterium]|nr:phosphoribosylglycinamide formyltransferase [Candidatus Neomarinimicrobiota bacterium]
MSTSIKLGVLGSTKGTDLQAIIDSINKKELNATIEVVISNSSNAYILERAANHNIPNYFILHLDKTREEFDAEISLILKKNKVDLVLLVGFMRILSSKFCREWKGRILNVHPSLLPKYAGGIDANVHKEVIKNRDTETGCTIHFVTETIDGGPILIQKKCSVDKNDTSDSLKRKVQMLEGMAFIDAIKIFQ